MKLFPAICCIALPRLLFGQLTTENPQAKTVNGIVEGVSHSGVAVFEGIPFAQPPVGDLRWREPQPVASWAGIKKADHFGPNPMEHPAGDMVFRSHGMSEDCLYLNVWTPAKSPEEKLPVLVYFYGGGFVSGDGSEYRYDGESMAHKGIVTLTVNYRLGVFGFLAHPALSKESPYHGSGDYGLLDQEAALRWVQQNIAAFGGDPGKVTIAGESAGSISVCSLMASPLSKGLFNGAIGESGGCFAPTYAPIPLADAEAQGVKLAATLGATSLAALRALPADRLLAGTTTPATPKIMLTIDGHFFTKTPLQTFAAGEQMHVPLLAGWNSGEANYKRILNKNAPTPENYAAAIKALYGDKAREALALYPGGTEQEVIRSANDLGSDRFIVYSTWKWCDIQNKTGGNPVYRYFFSRARPALRVTKNPAMASPSASRAPLNPGAVHSAEIEFALGNLSTNRVYDWRPADYSVSRVMQAYFANFIITGNPNGPGLPEWEPLNKGGAGKVMVIDVNTRGQEIKTDDRYHWLDQFYAPASR